MEQQEILDAVNNLVKKYLKNQSSGRFLDYREPGDLNDLLDIDNSASSGDWSKVLFWIEKYHEYSVKTNHPGFLNRMWAGANLPSLLGEIVVAAANTSSCTFESAPVSTVLEKYMLQQMVDLVGFEQGEGQMTTGSSNANMLAMMAARNECLESAKSQGMGGQPKVYAFTSADAHYSLEKAANILGIGTQNLVKVEVNDQGEMDMDHLEDNLKKVTQEGARPFFVCGTAGTTVRGAYDSITDLLYLRKKYPFWLHIDAAWGGAVLVSETLKDAFMSGINEVDSLTWDFHKMLGTSLICNVFLINKRVHTLGKVCSGGDDSYIFHGNVDNEVRDLGAVSLQCGRRVDSLKWFLDWKFFGRQEFARRVENSLQLCQYAENLVDNATELELVVPRNSFNICFRYRGTRENSSNFDELNLKIRDHLYRNGISLVGYAYHQNRPLLRLLLANHALTREDIDDYFDTIIQTGKTLEVES